MKIFNFYMLMLFIQVISATRHVLAGRSRQPVTTTHVAVRRYGSTLFQPNRVALSPGSHLVLDCYEDNLWLVKAAVDLSKIDNMPAMLICQKNSTLHLEILDTSPHLYYSPNVSPWQRFDQNLMLALNSPEQSAAASTALAVSPRPNSVTSSRILTLPPYPTGPSTGLGHATGTGRPFSSGRSNPSQHTNLPTVISPTTRLPVAPTVVPSLAPSGAASSDANITRGLRQLWVISGIASVATMLVV